MPKHVASKKFVSPSLKGEKCPGKIVGNMEESSSEPLEEVKLKAKVSRPFSEAQYDDLFTSVLSKTKLDKNGKLTNILHVEGNKEEDNVAVPEPNAALSPAESAEEGSSELDNANGTAVKTPDQRIDNSVLPPIKKKKIKSKIALLNLKVKPTRLNFDDPALQGEPDNLSKPKKSKPLLCKTSKKPKTSSKPSDSSDLKRPNIPDSKKKNCPKTPDVRGTQQKEFLTPTGGVLNDSQLSAGSIGHRRANHPTPNSSQLVSSQSSSVLMMALSPRSKLFRLQRKRNVGLWVQCTNKSCSKWRYLPSTRDPTEVPGNWQCFMNHDMKYASCSAPEKGPTPVEEEDLIHNIYTAGSVVWGHLAGYPWWPAIVDDDPDVEQYYWVTETCDIPTHYNVTFFDDKPVTRAWLTPGAITKYSQPNKDVLKMSAHGNDYSRRIEVAKRQAEEALKLSIDERLKKFSFVARYKGPIGKKRYPSDSEDDELIKKSMKRAGKVPRKDKNVSEEDPIIDFEASFEIVKEVNQVLNELSASEFDEDEESEEGNSNTKNSGMAKSKKEKDHHRNSTDRKHEDDKRKEIKRNNKKKQGKKIIEERSKIKEDNRINGKSKEDLMNRVEHKENKKKNKEIKGEKKKSKEIRNDDAGKVRKDKEKNRETKKNMIINIDIDAAPKKAKMEQSKGVNRVIRGVGVSTKTVFKNGQRGNDPGTKRNDGQSSSSGKSQEGKTKKKNDGRAEKETNNSETPKYESGCEDSSGESDVVRSISDNECSPMERNDTSSSDAEDSPDEELIECKNIGDHSEEDATSLSVKEMAVDHILVENSEDARTEADDCLPLPSPILSTTCGRSSADLFGRELDNVDQVSAGSQCSADFEVEE